MKAENKLERVKSDVKMEIQSKKSEEKLFVKPQRNKMIEE